jgi:chromosome segregation ATPase
VQELSNRVGELSTRNSELLGEATQLRSEHVPLAMMKQRYEEERTHIDTHVKWVEEEMAKRETELATLKKSSNAQIIQLRQSLEQEMERRQEAELMLTHAQAAKLVLLLQDNLRLFIFL